MSDKKPLPPLQETTKLPAFVVNYAPHMVEEELRIILPLAFFGEHGCSIETLRAKSEVMDPASALFNLVRIGMVEKFEVEEIARYRIKASVYRGFLNPDAKPDRGILKGYTKGVVNIYNNTITTPLETGACDAGGCAQGAVRRGLRPRVGAHPQEPTRPRVRVQGEDVPVDDLPQFRRGSMAGVTKAVFAGELPDFEYNYRRYVFMPYPLKDPNTYMYGRASAAKIAPEQFTRLIEGMKVWVPYYQELIDNGDRQFVPKLANFIKNRRYEDNPEDYRKQSASYQPLHPDAKDNQYDAPDSWVEPDFGR